MCCIEKRFISRYETKFGGYERLIAVVSTGTRCLRNPLVQKLVPETVESVEFLPPRALKTGHARPGKPLPKDLRRQADIVNSFAITIRVQELRSPVRPHRKRTYGEKLIHNNKEGRPPETGLFFHQFLAVAPKVFYDMGCSCSHNSTQCNSALMWVIRSCNGDFIIHVPSRQNHLPSVEFTGPPGEM